MNPAAATGVRPHAVKALPDGGACKGQGMNAEAPVRLFWTGGWDSTFRLLQLLLRYRLRVAPLYLRDDTRASSTIEIATMERIRATLADRFPETCELLRPTTYVHVSELGDDAEVQHAYDRLAVKHGIGSQYGWLARYDHQRNAEGVELTCESVPLGASGILLAHTVPTTSPQGYATYRLDPSESDPDVRMLFDGFAYPLIMTTRDDMVAIATANDWMELMAMTWFCHRPAPGPVPCGLCNPCRANIAEGFGWRIPRRRRALSAVYRYTWLPVRTGARRLLLRWRARER